MSFIRREYVAINEPTNFGARIEERLGGRLTKVVVKVASETKAAIIAEELTRAVDTFIRDNKLIWQGSHQAIDKNPSDGSSKSGTQDTSSLPTIER